VPAITDRIAHPGAYLNRENDTVARWGARAVAASLDKILAAGGLTAVASDDGQHRIELRPDGWTIKHPLACRPDLFDCPVNRAAEVDLTEPPAVHGVFRCELDLTGQLRIWHDDNADVRQGAETEQALRGDVIAWDTAGCGITETGGQA
jgi:hypothetical protein